MSTIRTARPATGRTTYHRDGTVTLWDVLTQSWRRLRRVPDAVLATLDGQERERVIRHTAVADPVALKALRALRDRLDEPSTAALARRLGCSRADLSQLLHGASLSLDRVQGWCAAEGLSLTVHPDGSVEILAQISPRLEDL